MNKKRCGIDLEKIDHVAYKYWCVLQVYRIIKWLDIWHSLGKVTSTVHRKKCIWDYTNMSHKNGASFLNCYLSYLEYEGIWRAMLFREHFLSDDLPHLHKNNDKAHKLFLTSSQNSTFSLKHNSGHAIFKRETVWNQIEKLLCVLQITNGWQLENIYLSNYFICLTVNTMRCAL